MNDAAVRAWVIGAWWVVMPPFAVLVARLAMERACAAPYELLPAATSVPAFAWALAALYIAAHALLAAAYLATAVHADALVPPLRAVRALWGRHVWMLPVAVVIFAIEYAPVPLWRLAGRVARCHS